MANHGDIQPALSTSLWQLCIVELVVQYLWERDGKGVDRTMPEMRRIHTCMHVMIWLNTVYSHTSYIFACLQQVHGHNSVIGLTPRWFLLVTWGHCCTVQIAYSCITFGLGHFYSITRECVVQSSRKCDMSIRLDQTNSSKTWPCRPCQILLKDGTRARQWMLMLNQKSRSRYRTMIDSVCTAFRD